MQLSGQTYERAVPEASCLSIFLSTAFTRGQPSATPHSQEASHFHLPTH